MHSKQVFPRKSNFRIVSAHFSLNTFCGKGRSLEGFIVKFELYISFSCNKIKNAYFEIINQNKRFKGCSVNATYN